MLGAQAIRHLDFHRILTHRLQRVKQHFPAKGPSGNELPDTRVAAEHLVGVRSRPDDRLARR
jgi:hypothetical protein